MDEKDQLEAGESEDLLEQSAGTSESATEDNEGSEEQQEQPTESQDGSETKLPPHVQEAVNKAIGRQHRQFREQQERAERAERRLQELQGNQQQEQRPVIPPVPDPLDDDFDQQIKVRDEAILKQAQFDARQANERQAQQQRQSQAMESQQRALVEKATTYKQRADALKVDPEALKLAGSVVTAYGLPDVLTEHILGHEQGPLITQHLASNLNDLEALRSMDPVNAGIFLASAIVPRLPAVKTKSGAPPPADGLGGPAAPAKQRGPEGCTYE